MDIQQLTLVINLIKDIADGAQWAFLLYLLVVWVLPYVVGTIALFFVYRFFSGWVAAVQSLSWWKEQAIALGQLKDCYVYYWPDVEKTKRLISEKLRSLK